MPKAPKLWIYTLARGLGLFALARLYSRRKVRILAYHGFATGDELRFRPKLFISPRTLERRLQLLRELRFEVVSLDQAVRNLALGKQAGEVVAITIDDGYASTLSLAAPVFERFGCPATVYLTTYHIKTQTPVFDVIAAYLLWKGREHFKGGWLKHEDQSILIDLTSAAACSGTLNRVLTAGHKLEAEASRVELTKGLSALLGVSYETVLSQDTFRLLSPSEVGQLKGFGLEVGLHTHRHRFPPGDFNTCKREIDDNRSHLHGMTNSFTNHFCYPSGLHSEEHPEQLRRLGVLSATTCEPGLVAPGDDLFKLCRFLDGEDVSEIEFIAEVSGFSDAMRRLFRREKGAGAPREASA
jgi:peptidoglycan/xylan/chitin deacetylase (PgdA/CDA1 family)